MSDGYECKCQDGYYQTDTGCVDFNTYTCRDYCLNGGVCNVVKGFQIKSKRNEISIRRKTRKISK